MNIIYHPPMEDQTGYHYLPNLEYNNEYNELQKFDFMLKIILGVRKLHEFNLNGKPVSHSNLSLSTIGFVNSLPILYEIEDF